MKAAEMATKLMKETTQRLVKPMTMKITRLQNLHQATL